MANDEMRRNWTEGADAWVENEATFDAVFAPATAALLDAAEPQPGERVLDVGCGSGTLLAALAEAGADPVGVDISEGMVEASRRRVPAASVLVADAQSADLLSLMPGRPFDRVISRFGVMFFADTRAAFANIARASAPGARLAFICWRTLAENPMFSLGTDFLFARLDPPPEPYKAGDPGPTALADPGRTRDLLVGAGWEGVDIAPFDFTCDFGMGGSDGVEERLAIILASNAGRMVRERLEPELGTAGWLALIDELREHLREHVVDGTVRFPGATWLVTARNCRR